MAVLAIDTPAAAAKTLLGSSVLTGATVTANAPVLDLSQTWNNAAASFVGLRANVSATASAPSSFLLDLRTNNVSKFTVDAVGGIVSSSDIYVSGDAYFRSNGSRILIGSVGDIILARDAPGTLSMRNANIPQVFRAYNSFVDNLNYERLSLGWSSNVAYLRAEASGSGSTRLCMPVTGGTKVSSLPAASSAGIGARSFVTDATTSTFGTAVQGGGAIGVPVVSDGSVWMIG